MQTLGRARDHYWRVIKMAKACDIDLADALEKGQITVAGCSEMITACRGCTQVGTCDRLMDVAPKVDAAPEYCENKDTFARLRHK